MFFLFFVVGHQQNANTNASASPPLTAQPSPLTPEHQHRELDELISDMMLTVESIPDLKPHPNINNTQTSITTTSSIISGGATTTNPGQNFTISDENVRFIDEEEDKNIPYHARQDSRPFTYGTMIGESKGLSSPSLVRKASFNKSTGDTLKKVQTQVFPDFNTNSNQSKYNTLQSPSATYKRDPIDDIFTTSALNHVNNHYHHHQQQQPPQPYKREFKEEFYKEEVKRYDPMKRSYTDGTIRKSPEKINSYKTSSSVITSPYSDTESLSPPREFRNNTKSPEFHET